MTELDFELKGHHFEVIRSPVDESIIVWCKELKFRLTLFPTFNRFDYLLHYAPHLYEYQLKKEKQQIEELKKVLRCCYEINY